MRNFLFTVMIVASSLGAQKADPVGTWNCKASTPNGNEVPWTLEVTRQEGKLVATAKSERGGEMRATETRMEGDTFSFEVAGPQGTVQVKVTIKGDEFEGAWKGGDSGGSMKGVRK